MDSPRLFLNSVFYDTGLLVYNPFAEYKLYSFFKLESVCTAIAFGRDRLKPGGSGVLIIRCISNFSACCEVIEDLTLIFVVP